MNKLLKKILKITGITLLVLIVAAFLIPVLFKKQITALVKKEINNSLTASVDFKDVSLSLFRHFPRVSIALDNLTVIGTGEFAKDTLISTKLLDASVNLFSVIKGKDIKVYGVYLHSPRIHALVNKDGKANWDIAKAETDTTTEADTAASEFKMQLKKYQISDGYIYYKDETMDMSTELSGINHEGSGDLTADVFTLATKTNVEQASFTYEGIPYLVSAKTAIDADIQIDNAASKYSFKTDDILINNLKLNADGFFQIASDSSYNMDIRFNTPSNEFKDILSLVPGIYKQDFEKIKTAGTASFSGFVKGVYSPVQLPAYDVNLGVKDGSFQYPDLPKPVKNIQIDMRVSNADGRMDNTVVDLSRGHLEMDNEPFDIKVLFKNPETTQYIDGAAKGSLDLGNVSKFIKLPDGTKLAGRIAADMFAKGSISALQAQAGNFNAGGFLDISRLFYSSPAFPQPLQNGNLKIQIENSGGIADNTSINISSGHIEVGQDPFDFSLQLRKPTSVAEFAGTAKGRFTLDNIKQFVALEQGTTVKGILTADLAFSGNKIAIDKGEYDKIVLNGSGELNNFKYVSPDYPGGVGLTNTRVQLTPKTVTLSNLDGDYLGTRFNANGNLTNLVGYALHDQPLGGTVNVSADKMNLNDWMGTDTATVTAKPAPGAPPATTPFEVPSNINLVLNANVKQVTYDKVNYDNINGTLALADETVKIQNVKAEALGGTMLFNGSYSTRDSKTQPAITMSYDVKDIDIQKAFSSFNTVQKLMPIGQFLAGKLSSQLTMNGKMNGEMMPDLSSLTGKGNLLLVEGLLKKFAPLEKIASTLQIEELKSITIRDVKNYIEFANGKVLVKPFPVKVKDIELQIGGMHGLDQSMDYSIQMKVPRKYLGTQGNSIVNGLAAQANSKGIPVKLGDVVDLNIRMGGTMTNPSIKTDLKEVAGDAVKNMQQQAADFAKAKADTIKQTVKDSLASVKNQVVAGVKDEIKNKLLGKKDSTGSNNIENTKKNTEQTIKNTLNGMFKKKKQPADTTKH